MRIAVTPEESEFTSIYERIREIRRTTPGEKSAKRKANNDTTIRIPLVPFKASAPSHDVAIPFRFQDYLALVDWTGRALVKGKCAIDGHLPPILKRLNIDVDAWQLAMRPSGHVFGRAMGRLDHLRLHAKTLGESWVRGLRQAERLYSA